MSEFTKRFGAPGILAAFVMGEDGCDQVGDDRWNDPLFRLSIVHEHMIEEARLLGWKHEDVDREIPGGLFVKEPAPLRTTVECNVGSPSVGKVLIAVETIDGMTYAVAMMSSSPLTRSVRRMIRKAAEAMRKEKQRAFEEGAEVTS